VHSKKIKRNEREPKAHS